MEGQAMSQDLELAMELLIQLMPLIIPLALLQLTLLIIALIHILRNDTYKTGSRLIWVLVCIFVNIIGPILYFVIGRSED
jgi:hypothetical protein